MEQRKYFFKLFFWFNFCRTTGPPLHTHHPLFFMSDRQMFRHTNTQAGASVLQSTTLKYTTFINNSKVEANPSCPTCKAETIKINTSRARAPSSPSCLGLLWRLSTTTPQHRLLILTVMHGCSREGEQCVSCRCCCLPDAWRS